MTPWDENGLVGLQVKSVFLMNINLHRVKCTINFQTTVVLSHFDRNVDKFVSIRVIYKAVLNNDVQLAVFKIKLFAFWYLVAANTN